MMKSSSLCVFVLWMNMAAVIMFNEVEARHHTASISMNGLRATVSFTPSLNASSVNITITLECSECVQDSDQFSWNVYEFPMIYDRAEKCSTDNIGNIFTEGGGSLNNTHGSLHGFQLNSGPVSFLNGDISFEGVNSLSGRTIMLEKVVVSTVTKYCASIIPYGAEVVTAVATFQYPVAGIVTFRQRIGKNIQNGLSISVDLDVTSSPQTSQTLMWQIRSNRGVTSSMTIQEQCAALNDELTYNLADKFGNLTLRTVENHKKYYFFDPDLSMDGEHSILGKSLVLSYTNGSMISCPIIQNLEARTVESVILVKNISGTIMFRQRSPWDYSTIYINVSNLRSLIKGYHIHKYPIPPRYFESDNLGDPNSVSGHWNPYGVTNFPTIGTEDQYEIGDLSSKFGSLEGKDYINEAYKDWNMPLFGTNSIVGRSIVLHLAADNSRFAYGQISYPTSTKTVVVDLKAPVTGRIIMRQDENNPLSETTVFVDVANTDATATVDHNWHVHVNKIGNDYLAEKDRCVSNGGHFNPFYVDLDDYAGCSPLNPRRCEAGDFSGKHGKLNIPGTLHTEGGKFFFTDVQLPLSGPYSIDGRSVVVHDQNTGAARLSCHNIYQVLRKEVNTTEWSDPAISGSILFGQNGLYDPTHISVNIRGINYMANGWHVHVLPVPYGKENVCGLTQGHFNPFNVDGSPPSSTLDFYEVGDLSGKFVTFKGKAETTEEFDDQTITLRGPHSIDGRSVVIHRDDDGGSRWSCATLEEVLAAQSFSILASAEFDVDLSEGDISGTIMFRQTHQENGYLADTSIHSTLVIADSGGDGEVINWSVLESTDISKCRSDSQVYDPFNIQEDSTECSLARHGQCIMGNLGGRHGAIPNGGAVFTDTNLPLVGNVPIIGRILRIEVDGEFYCSQIKPTAETGIAMRLSFPSSIDFDPYEFRLAVSTNVESLDMWQIVVSESTPLDHPTLQECQTVEFWVIGADVEQLVDDIKEVEHLGDYSPGECVDLKATPSPDHASTTKTHIVLFSLSFVITLFYSFM